jgi:hypothetical protein
MLHDADIRKLNLRSREEREREKIIELSIVCTPCINK